MTTWTCVRCGRPADESRLTATASAEYLVGRCLNHRIGHSLFATTTDGETLKQRGMAIVETAEGIHTGWVTRADAAIAQLAQRGTPFSAEDVAAIAGRPDHPNAVGARFNAAARRGIIVKAGVVKASRPERHRNEMRLWIGA